MKFTEIMNNISREINPIVQLACDTSMKRQANQWRKQRT